MNGCSCKDDEGGEDYVAPHPCPYALEINDNDEPCTCCPDCTSQCAQDI